MQIHIARNGVTLGSFDLDALKAKATLGEIKLTDHAYIDTIGSWKLISDVPELLELFPQVVEKPTPPPPPPGAELVSLPQPELVVAAQEAQTDEEFFHGYPIQYWKEYFGDNSYWFLDKFKGMESRQESGGKDDPTRKQIRFSLAALIFGWGWLAYRKCIGLSLTGLLLCGGITYFVKHVAQSGPPDPDGTHTNNMIMFVLAAIFFMQIVPSMYSILFIHDHVIDEFKSTEKKTSNPIERLRRIKESGGTSWLYVLIYVVLFIAYEAIAS